MQSVKSRYLQVSQQSKKVDPIFQNTQILFFITLAFSRSSLISDLKKKMYQHVVIKFILDITSFTWPAGMLSNLLRMLFWSELFRGYHDKHLVIAWDSKQSSFPCVLHHTAFSLHSKICIFYVANNLQNIKKKKK